MATINLVVTVLNNASKVFDAIATSATAMGIAFDRAVESAGELNLTVLCRSSSPHIASGTIPASAANKGSTVTAVP